MHFNFIYFSVQWHKGVRPSAYWDYFLATRLHLLDVF